MREESIPNRPIHSRVLPYHEPGGPIETDVFDQEDLATLKACHRALGSVIQKHENTIDVRDDKGNVAIKV
jgi:hypothetical protein